MNLTPEEQLVGKQNYYEAIGVTRRDFLRGVVGAGAVSGAGLGAMYFGYGDQTDPNKGLANPVRIGIIGTGDEGGVLIGALNPKYVQVVAMADIRPYNIHRGLHGDWSSEGSLKARPGLMSKYGWKSEDEARRNMKVYDQDYHDLLNDDDVEAVIIALPLFLHHPVAIEAMKAGKHVLTEKLMAHSIGQCKEMSRVANSTWKNGNGLYLATGHQRHYSVLYDNAVHLMKNHLLGEVQFIRAQWHRGNLPGNDSWKPPLPGGMKTYDGDKIDPIASKLKSLRNRLNNISDPDEYRKVEQQAMQWAAWDLDQKLRKNNDKYGMALYESMQLDNNYERTAFEELCRWRLWDRTGGGLMAELGSHQLDAASIFVSALHGEGEHVHPLNVYATGGRHTFPYDRDADDHVYCTFEYPGPGYPKPANKQQSLDAYGYVDPITGYPLKNGIPPYEKDHHKKIVYTYSSIMGNPFGGYGETVMGSKGTMMLHREQEVMLWKAGAAATTRVSVKKDDGKAATMDAYETGGSGPVAEAAQSAGPVSRGYTEEIEHWAWCIRNPDPENQPKCKPEIAVADAIAALTAKKAIGNSQSDDPKKKAGSYIVFQDEWFDIDNDATPDGSKPRSAEEALKKPYG